MELHLTYTGRIMTQGHRRWYRVVTPRGVRVADYTTKAEAEARVVAEYGRHGADCHVEMMEVGQ